MQDHDRALIVGETTFGKGLVQTVFQITENTGLALTTYHYYTPSGRLIQRNYNNVSLYDYYYVRDSAKQPKDKANLEVKLTDSGRTVYGGGGITPDEKIDNLKSNRFQDSLLQHYAFFNFSKHYLASHNSVRKDFVVDDAVMQEFKTFLKSQNVDYTDQDIAGVQDWMKESIKSELFTSQFGQLEGLKVRAEWDPQIAKAITFLPEAQTLQEHLKLAQKTNPSESLILHGLIRRQRPRSPTRAFYFVQRYSASDIEEVAGESCEPNRSCFPFDNSRRRILPGAACHHRNGDLSRVATCPVQRGQSIAAGRSLRGDTSGCLALRKRRRGHQNDSHRKTRQTADSLLDSLCPAEDRRDSHLHRQGADCRESPNHVRNVGEVSCHHEGAWQRSETGTDEYQAIGWTCTHHPCRASTRDLLEADGT